MTWKKWSFVGVFFIINVCLLIGIVKESPIISVQGNVASKRKLPIYCVETEKKQIAITFDAAWGIEDLPQILHILKKYQVPATFFVTGEWVEQYPDETKQLLKEGHDIGNHGDHHKYMTQLGKDEMKTEMKGVYDKVKKVTGKEIELFRPPYGDYDETVISTAKDEGYFPIQWSVDSLDWKNYGADSIVETVLHHKHLTNGAIILLHNGTKYTKDALEPLLKGLKEKGYSFISVAKLIYRENYAIDVEGKQFSKREK